MSKRALFVATVVKTHIMEFHVPYLRMLQEMGWQTAVAARNDYREPGDCRIPCCDAYHDIPFERSPFRLANLRAFRALKRLIGEGGYDLIHCHTPVGAMLTRLAAIGARRKGTKVVYTAHGFHFFRGAPLINWLLYYPVEWFLARFTDVLITINQEDYARAQRFAAGKACYVPGVGVDMQRFCPDERQRADVRAELGFAEEDFVLLSVGELIARKNHEAILRAMAEMKGGPGYERLHCVICGGGALEASLKTLAEELGVADHIRFTGYRTDIPALLNASDLFVFMSLQEGLPVALLEAMSCGIPSVCTRIRGNTDLITDGREGYLIDNDPALLARRIAGLMQDPAERARLGAAARQKAAQFSLERVASLMRDIYEKI